MSQRKPNTKAEQNGTEKPRSNGQTPKTNGHRQGRVRGYEGGPDQMLGSALASQKAPDLIATLAELDLPEETVQLLQAELSRDHILANYSEADITWRKWGLQNTREIVEASHPPKESIWQGNLRKEAGLDEARRTLSPKQRQHVRSAIEAAFSRTTRGGPQRGMAQQKLLAEQQTERRVVEDRMEDERSGWLAKLIG